MPVVMKITTKPGWRAKENARTGNCLVVLFMDSKTNHVLFEYAPRFGDQDFWNMAFKTLEQYDAALGDLKAVQNKIKEMEDTINSSQAESLKEGQVKC